MITLNTPGARTLADVTRWIVDGHGVYVLFSGETAELHLRGRKVADRPAAEIQGTADAQDWAVEYLAAEAEQADAVAAEFEAAVTTPSTAVAQVRARGAEMLVEAAEMEALGTTDHRIRRTVNGENRGWIRIGTQDPRHPARKAAQLRRSANVLMCWDANDETAYGRYVADGLAATDGHYAPEPREAWASSRKA